MVDAFLGHSVVIMVNVIDDRYKNVFFTFLKIFVTFLTFFNLLTLFYCCRKFWYKCN